MLSCSSFWDMMSLTSELTEWFHHLHAFLKSHLQISMGQLLRATNWRRLPSKGRRWGALILWPFPCFLEIVLCTLPWLRGFFFRSLLGAVIWIRYLSGVWPHDRLSQQDKKELIIWAEFPGSFPHNVRVRTHRKLERAASTVLCGTIHSSECWQKSLYASGAERDWLCSHASAEQDDSESSGWGVGWPGPPFSCHLLPAGMFELHTPYKNNPCFASSTVWLWGSRETRKFQRCLRHFFFFFYTETLGSIFETTYLGIKFWNLPGQLRGPSISSRANPLNGTNGHENEPADLLSLQPQNVNIEVITS